MIKAVRCCVCGRLLAYATSDVSRGVQYCPDRPCILYPPVPVNAPGAGDPTISALAFAIRTTTGANGEQVSQAMGKRSAWLSETAGRQRKRWEKER